MKHIIEYLSEQRNIDVSPSDADTLATYWRKLRERRPDGNTSVPADEDIPVIFNPTEVRNDE